MRSFETKRAAIASTLLLACVSLFSGCASLNVSVAVLNPQVAEAEADRLIIKEVLPKILAGSFRNDFTDLKNAHGGAVIALSQTYAQAASKDGLSESEKAFLIGAAEGLQNSFPREWEPIYNDVEKQVNAIDGLIERLNDRKESTTDASIKDELVTMIAQRIKERQDIIRNLQRMVRRDFEGGPSSTTNEAITGAKQNVANRKALALRKDLLDKLDLLDDQVRVAAEGNANLQQEREKIPGALKQLFYGGDLINSPLAYAVVSASDDKWGLKFDHSHAKGLFGNTDIAIKAIGPGNFTVKGVSFNPADVAQAASKVTTQAVLLAAQIAGVPVNIVGAPDTPGAGLSASSQRLATAQADLGVVKARMMGFEEALMVVAKAIVDEETGILGTSVEREEAIKAIRAVYEAQKPRLQLPEEETK